MRRDIAEAAADGLAVLIISTDLDELVATCSRILVVSGSRIVAEFDGAESQSDPRAFVSRIGEAMTGAREEALAG